MILNYLLSPWTVLFLPLVLFYILPYLSRKSHWDIPSPFPAQFTNLWLLYHSRRAQRSLAVDAAHKRLGPLVRIQPNHVSVADDKTIPIIYGHGNGFLKSEFYDAFVSIHRGLFNTRDRAQHSRKRKIVSHTFSTQSVGQFEQYIHHNLEDFVKQWDRISSQGGAEGFLPADAQTITSPSAGEKAATELSADDKRTYAAMDALHWFNYLAFDVIGDLAFGAPFGMLEKGADVAEVRSSPESEPTFAPAIEVLNRRGEVSATIGCFPAMKPWARNLPDPFFSKGVRAVENLAGIATARVKHRLDTASTDPHQPQRVDLLARLQQGKDDTGAPLGREELTAEALTQLIAGSDTTSNSSCALLYHVLRTPHVLPKLQAELDEAIPAGVEVPTYEMVRDLPYVEQVINETLRIHSTSSMGLPRVVPPGPGVEILGRHFPPGSVLSVPAYTIHHSTSIWGADADAFVPERWEKERLTERQKNAFIPFSYGPRACVGRNVAVMELALTVGTVFRRYEFLLCQGDLETREGFLRKPLGLRVGMRLRREMK